MFTYLVSTSRRLYKETDPSIFEIVTLTGVLLTPPLQCIVGILFRISIQLIWQNQSDKNNIINELVHCFPIV